MKRVKTAWNVLRGRTQPRRDVTITDAENLMRMAFWSERDRPVLNVPPSMLRILGGYAYGPGHPMVQALREGRSRPLETFHRTVQPGTLSDFYDLRRMEDQPGAHSDPAAVPWHIDVPRDTARAKPLYRFFGPPTPGLIETEMKRLVTVRESIGKNGYLPEKFGHIEGYILRDGDDACLMVSGGKHRAAVLADLEMPTIPIMFHPRYSRMIDTAQLPIWPRVANGSVAPDIARQIARTHIVGRTFDPENAEPVSTA